MSPRLQQDAATGSKSASRRGTQDRLATPADVHHLLGRPDDLLIAEILSQQPTIAELEQAVMWSRGDGDIADIAGQPLSGKAAALFQIITAYEPDEDEGPLAR